MASWLAPLAVFAIEVALDWLRTAGVVGPGAAIAFVPYSAAIVLFGLGAGVAALMSMRHDGSEGIKRPATIGVTLCALIIALLGFGFIRGITRHRAAPRLDLDAEFEKAALSAGWLGAGSTDGSKITVIAVDEKSALAEIVRKSFRQPASVAIVSIDTPAGAAERTIDLGSLIVRYPDGSSVGALSRQPYLDSATEFGAPIRALAQQPLRARPGGSPVGALAFLPAGLAMADAVAVDLLIDGQPFVVHGRLLSAEEKAIFYNRAPSDESLRGRRRLTGSY